MGKPKALAGQGLSLFHKAQSGEEAGDFEGVFSQGGGDVRHALRAQGGEEAISQSGQDLRSVALFNLARIFAEGDVANVVRAVFDSPVAAIAGQ